MTPNGDRWGVTWVPMKSGPSAQGPQGANVTNHLDDIIETVKTRRDPLITVEEAVKAQEIIEAVYIGS